MFLVPLLISMVVVSLFPGIYDSLGGTTQAAFSTEGTNAVIGFLVFAAGTTIDFKQIASLMKRHLPLIVFKLAWSAILITIFYFIFGIEGIAGISLLTFTCVIFSLNPAIALAIHKDYGDQQFGGVYGLYGMFGLSFTPLILLSFLTADGGSGGIDWMPIISIFLPLIVGMILGNIDKNFASYFSPIVGLLLPFLGWNLGAGMNLGDAFQSGLAGLLMAVVFLVLMLPIVLFDRYITKNNAGIDGIAIYNVAGISAANPAIVAAAMPVFANDVTSATAIVMMCVIITSIFSPIFAQKVFMKEYGARNVAELEG